MLETYLSGRLQLKGFWARASNDEGSDPDVIDVIDRVPRLQTRAAHLKERMKNDIISNLAYAREHGTDRAEITDWVWPY